MAPAFAQTTDGYFLARTNMNKNLPCEFFHSKSEESLWLRVLVFLHVNAKTLTPGLSLIRLSDQEQETVQFVLRTSSRDLHKDKLFGYIEENFAC